MSQTNSAPADAHLASPSTAPGERHKQRVEALRELIEVTAPWLFEFGIWIFGSLIAFDFFLLAAFVTVGPSDPAILVSAAVVALSLPLNVAGLLMLRLVHDLGHAGSEDELAQAFRDIGSAFGEPVLSPAALEARRKRRMDDVVGASTWIAALSVILTLVVLSAVLWHMAWWIAITFVVMVAISLSIVAAAMAASQPPDSDERKVH